MPLKLGAQVLTYGSSWGDALATAQLVDELGYDYLWGHDHLYSTGGDPYQPFFEGWTTLAAWAALTRRVRLGLLVGANTFRNPGVVAKMAVTIDHVSGGRSILGLGAGNVEFENRAHGIDPGRTLGERIDWFEESLAIVCDLLAGREVTTGVTSTSSTTSAMRRCRSRRASRWSSGPRANDVASALPHATRTSGNGLPARTTSSCSDTRTTSFGGIARPRAAIKPRSSG